MTGPGIAVLPFKVLGGYVHSIGCKRCTALVFIHISSSLTFIWSDYMVGKMSHLYLLVSSSYQDLGLVLHQHVIQAQNHPYRCWPEHQPVTRVCVKDIEKKTGEYIWHPHWLDTYIYWTAKETSSGFKVSKAFSYDQSTQSKERFQIFVITKTMERSQFVVTTVMHHLHIVFQMVHESHWNLGPTLWETHDQVH